jgi:hypothetical protein
MKTLYSLLRILRNGNGNKSRKFLKERSRINRLSLITVRRTSQASLTQRENFSISGNAKFLFDHLSLNQDNGAGMRGSVFMSTMSALGVKTSFSRPGISDDNPFSETRYRIDDVCRTDSDKARIIFKVNIPKQRRKAVSNRPRISQKSDGIPYDPIDLLISSQGSL